jgi:hypothetical protein
MAIHSAEYNALSNERNILAEGCQSDEREFG